MPTSLLEHAQPMLKISTVDYRPENLGLYCPITSLVADLLILLVPAHIEPGEPKDSNSTTYYIGFLFLELQSHPIFIRIYIIYKKWDRAEVCNVLVVNKKNMFFSLSRAQGDITSDAIIIGLIIT